MDTGRAATPHLLQPGRAQCRYPPVSGASQHPAPQKAEEKAKELKEEARKQLLKFPGSPAKKMLENIASYFVERTY